MCHFSCSEFKDAVNSAGVILAGSAVQPCRRARNRKADRHVPIYRRRPAHSRVTRSGAYLERSARRHATRQAEAMRPRVMSSRDESAAARAAPFHDALRRYGTWIGGVAWSAVRACALAMPILALRRDVGVVRSYPHGERLAGCELGLGLLRLIVLCASCGAQQRDCSNHISQCHVPLHEDENPSRPYMASVRDQLVVKAWRRRHA